MGDSHTRGLRGDVGRCEGLTDRSVTLVGAAGGTICKKHTGRSTTKMVGFFKQEEAAARAHDRAALYEIGEDARTNFLGYDLEAVRQDTQDENAIVRRTHRHTPTLL